MTNADSIEASRVALHHEGDDLLGCLYAPKSPERLPGVLVMSSAMGLGPHYHAIARRIAAEGYAALATDMYGDGAYDAVPGGSCGLAYGRLQETEGAIRARSLAWLETLRGHSRVNASALAAVGYCFGGHCVLELARSGADLAAVVSFHGTLTTTRKAIPGQVRPLIAVYTGALDPFAPAEDVAALQAEMAAAGAHLDLTVFGNAAHAFTTREDGGLPIPGLAYDALADAVSWAGMLAVLRTTLDVRDASRQ
jgi:dienelactone hydrolase